MINYVFFKHSLAFKTRTITVFFLMLAALIFTSSCSSNNANASDEKDSSRSQDSQAPDATEAKVGARGAFVTSDELHTLYVENKNTNIQLGKLLNSQSKKKLVFQIYRDENGFMRLLVIPSQEKNSKYFLTDTIQPLMSNVVQATFPKSDVNLSDLQLTNEQHFHPIKELRENIGNPQNKADWRYIWFVPVIVPVRDNDTPPSPFVKDYVKYQIWHSDVLPFILEKEYLNKDKPDSFKVNLTTISLLGQANPSPPRTLE